MKAVVLRHMAHEDLGVWGSVLRERGHQVSYIDAGDDVSRGAESDLLVVLGGPIGLADRADYPFLDDEVSLVRDRLERDAPTLGVCLGAQVMAAALGARVYPGLEREIGWGFVTLVDEAPTVLTALKDVPVLHWHRDTFDLPDGATRLASTGLTPNQAFSHGRSLALQFHCEVSGGLIERWLIANSEVLREEGIAPGSLREASRRYSLSVARAGREFLDAYLATLIEES
ncbi:MAG: glutamine amidotransferase [Demequinaceae bacterium]|nr:glutamine amidotransferase [Demequinaceae bacterium]